MNKEKYNIQQGINKKRGEYERERRKKYLRLKHLGQYFIAQRSEVSKDIKTALPKVVEPKVAEQKEIMYSFLKSLVKGIKYPLIVGIGLLIAGFEMTYPEVASLSVGSVLIIAYDVIKHKASIRLP